MSRYVEVITSLPIDRTFQYEVTGREEFAPEVGKRVHIPFRGQKRIGYIVKLEDKAMVERPRALIDIIDESPLFTDVGNPPGVGRRVEWTRTGNFDRR